MAGCAGGPRPALGRRIKWIACAAACAPDGRCCLGGATLHACAASWRGVHSCAFVINGPLLIFVEASCRVPAAVAHLPKLGKQSAKLCLGCLLSLCSRSLSSVLLHMNDWRQMLHTAAGGSGRGGGAGTRVSRHVGGWRCMQCMPGGGGAGTGRGSRTCRPTDGQRLVVDVQLALAACQAGEEGLIEAGAAVRLSTLRLAAGGWAVAAQQQCAGGLGQVHPGLASCTQVRTCTQAAHPPASCPSPACAAAPSPPSGRCLRGGRGRREGGRGGREAGAPAGRRGCTSNLAVAAAFEHPAAPATQMHRPPPRAGALVQPAGGGSGCLWRLQQRRRGRRNREAHRRPWSPGWEGASAGGAGAVA